LPVLTSRTRSVAYQMCKRSESQPAAAAHCGACDRRCGDMVVLHTYSEPYPSVEGRTLVSDAGRWSVVRAL